MRDSSISSPALSSPVSSSPVSSSPASASAAPRANANGGTWHIVTFSYFTFICYLTIGLPLAILPTYVHLGLGMSAVLAGLVISVQYVATFASRPWAGRISDTVGARISVLWGMACCAGSGLLLLFSGALTRQLWLGFSVLVLSRLALGVGESLSSTGATLWGIASAGPEHTAKVISFNGISTYGGLALGAPLGVVIEQHASRYGQGLGLGLIGILILLLCAGSYLAAQRKASTPIAAGEHLPFRAVLVRVAPHGLGLAMGGIGFSVLATFVTLFYAGRHWDGAALCLTAFGAAFIAARLLFIRTISQFGGFPVALVSLAVESLGLILLWRSWSPGMALGGAALAGFGFALVFPALGVEAVRRVPEQTRGTALGVFTGFADVSFFLTGPVAGAVIGRFGYASVFLFALLAVLAALGMVTTLALQASQPENS